MKKPTWVVKRYEDINKSSVAQGIVILLHKLGG